MAWDETKACDGRGSCLRRVPLFRGLPAQDIELFSKEIHSKRYKKGEHVFRRGDTAEGLYVIHHGVVKITTLSNEGKEHILRFLFQGDFDGVDALFNDKSHYAFAEAVEDAVVCTIYRSDLKVVLMRHPDIAYRLLGVLSARLRDADERAGSLRLMDAERRLAKTLVLFGERVPFGVPFELPFPKKDLAALIGVAPETLSRRLSAFESAGYISMNGQKGFTIRDAEALRRLAAMD
ncbi:Crp/Fnr family transcriptional regulator [Alicyclobacillus sp.]|uniref:Crp/Fnr family transcriptional regulator n=1 Tax=Alicyclobacillus sp. TaxID=61169 RepID=UPI0025C12490|nr:Crp/Fnr family transcriptional regulator [Alicyclobacillus sp.]MCL6517046.1 Crp/Fnr family transcriptional regulator [Alicyclobacillus sp.]